MRVENSPVVYSIHSSGDRYTKSTNFTRNVRNMHVYSLNIQKQTKNFLKKKKKDCGQAA